MSWTFHSCRKGSTIFSWPQSKLIIAAAAKNTPRFCKKLPPIFQLAKHHRSQRLEYWNSRREETITTIHQRALQKDHIFLVIRSAPDPICTSSGWVHQLPHITTGFIQDRNMDEASRKLTTTIKVCNKNKRLPNSAPKSWNWIKLSNDSFLIS